MTWRISQFPELKHLDPAHRSLLLKQLPRRIYVYWILVSIVPALIGLPIAALMSETLNHTFGWLVVAGFLMLAIALYQSQLRSFRRTMREEIAKAFRGMRPTFCLSCGYDFRSLTSDRCPECGHAIGGSSKPQ